VLTLSAALILLACKEEKHVSVPDHILSKEKFVRVLVDLSLAESAANLNVKNVRIEKIDSTYAFDPLKENQVSKEQYEASALFYTEHPDLYKEVYDEALKTLTEMQVRKKLITDSVKK
jgi:hypothetical protein